MCCKPTGIGGAVVGYLRAVSADSPLRVADTELLSLLVDSAPVGAAVLDKDLRYAWVNEVLSEMNGVTQAEHLGRRPREVLGRLGEELEGVLERVMRGDSSLLNHRFSGRRPGASGYWMGSYFPLRDGTGAVVGAGAIVTDVTAYERGRSRERHFLTGLVRVAQAVASRDDPREVLAAVAKEAAAVLALDGAVVARFRPEGVSLEGRWGIVAEIGTAGEVLPAATTPLTERVRSTGRPQRMTSESPDALGFRTRVAAPIMVGGVLWGAVKAGTPQLVDLPSDAELRLARFAELVGMAVTNAETQRRLIEEASRDPLTDLANRRAFQERLETEAQRALRHGGSFSLVLLDIDEFKAVNDTHGHDVGDQVLIETARRLSEEVRREDLLARVGGEEFAWILPDIGGIDAFLAADRARQLIADAAFEQVGRVTISAGIANFTEAGDIETLYRQADRALYEAKRRGRNRALVHAEIGDGTRPDLLASDVQKARRAEQAHALPALRALARAIDAKNPATFQHSERVAHLAQKLAQRLGWSRARALALRDAALLHDVGKVGIPEQLLFKSGPLTPDEYEQIKTHAQLSSQLAREVVSPEQAEWILHHHERWDGSGYPAGLAGDKIPDGAQLLALADAWDAMTVARPYAQPLSPTEALSECVAAAGRQFAPEVVDALRDLQHEDADDPGGIHGIIARDTRRLPNRGSR